MAKQSRKQQKTVSRVMREFKQGKLESGSGRKVEDRKQAIAIALDEAGASREKTPRSGGDGRRKTGGKQRSAAARRKPNERSGERGGRAGGRAAAQPQTRAQLYEEARRRDVPGRSRMSKADLERALKRR
jgi:hypothetical protein